MQCVSWHGPGGYDRFIRVDDGNHYYLVNDKKRVLNPLKMPSLAFGGMWNGYPPYGDETDCHFSLDTLPEYRLEPDWRAPK